MKLQQAVAAFSTVTVDGWDQATGTWLVGVAKGAILTFDRFITERSFGQKKRIFQMAGGVGLPSNVTALRDPTGRRWLVSYDNKDIQHDEAYNTVYQIQRADHDGELIQLTTQVAASGTATSKTETVVATFPMDFEKISTSGSSEFSGVYYSGFIATIPAVIPAGTNNELRVEGNLYDIEEVYESIGMKQLKLNKRSGTA